MEPLSRVGVEWRAVLALQILLQDLAAQYRGDRAYSAREEMVTIQDAVDRTSPPGQYEEADRREIRTETIIQWRYFEYLRPDQQRQCFAVLRTETQEKLLVSPGRGGSAIIPESESGDTSIPQSVPRVDGTQHEPRI